MSLNVNTAGIPVDVDVSIPAHIAIVAASVRFAIAAVISVFTPAAKQENAPGTGLMGE